MADLAITVFKPAGRKFFLVQWRDPVTGKKKTRSTGEARKREAERKAGTMLKDITEGNLNNAERVTWATFRQRYEEEFLPGKADGTANKVDAVFNMFERLVGPKLLASVDASVMSLYVKRMRAAGRSESTLKGHLAHMKAALRWAHRIGILAKVPAIEMPTRCNGMKGRPVTLEEFERMLKCVPDVVGEQDAEMWRFILRGFWWSGLRRSELWNLTWDDDRMLCVDLDGRRPMFRIRGDAHKSGKDCLLPMPPEFAEMLGTIPESERTGHVFNARNRATGKRLKSEYVGQTITRIGKRAGVKVADGRGKVKFASAHDLRRSFGFRWAGRIMPNHLQSLMRHTSISTTLTFYVGRNSEATADALWEAVSNMPEASVANTLANTAPELAPLEQR